jgi:hypothetical protein
MTKALVLGCFVLAAAGPSWAQSETAACPIFYPSDDTPIAETPYQHMGKGIVKRRPLRDASAFDGEFNGATELQGARQDVKNGYDVELPLVTKWLVCSYGNGIEWWERLKPAERAKSCRLQVRKPKGQPVDARFVCD